MRTLLASVALVFAGAACNVGSADLPPPVSDGVACGASKCDDTCCVTDGGAACAPSANACNGGGSLVCDGPEDCGSVDSCCATVSGAASGRLTYCSAAAGSSPCTNASDVVVCHVAGDCPKGQTCIENDTAGGASFVKICR